MSAKTTLPDDQSAIQLQPLGEQLRARRKALRVSSTAAAEAAGMSRVTLHRIEKGEPSVACGAWANAAAALGMTLMVRKAADAEAANGRASPADLTQWIPVRVRLADYPQLKALAWQVHGTDTLSPLEALGIYERNARHLDIAAMTPTEQALLEALRAGLGDAAVAEAPDV
jgi:transcriptional regulator with XRE-family HTH domain